MIRIAPSILSCDFAKLGEEALAIKNAGGEVLHVDVMDGHFVPNISFGMPVIKSLRNATDLFLDVHLMISRPIDYIEQFAKAGSDLITFHMESEGNCTHIINKIRSCGKQVGISISPNTPVQSIFPYLELVDLVLVMSVHPGFGGQSFIPATANKVSELANYRTEKNLNFIIEVDGGITAETAPLVADKGAQLLVAGSAVFGKSDYKAAMEAILNACDSSEKSV